MFVAESALTAGLLIPLVIVGALIWLARSRSSTLTRECPSCKKRMRGDASVCPSCQRESEPWVEHDGVWWRKDDAGRWEYRKSLGDGGAKWVRHEPTKTAAAGEP